MQQVLSSSGEKRKAGQQPTKKEILLGLGEILENAEKGVVCVCTM